VLPALFLRFLLLLFVVVVVVLQAAQPRAVGDN
jgi:hypothetical protein